ncbi:uncharacterized protein CTRU02_202461 [Colletotrichum truncatum]|uniref:Uncharacterized protein n=1 Tax=Colletotrichum truncatum TaxID=5467 RepID=A0ACC3ZKD1_COLTU|nr:uncharacterized protein CTRU02_01630 [Colletotrichum truncatum]KAF6799951.1 hypothetical protein CTRU02_01630 [Colletotrichum truncatum]
MADTTKPSDTNMSGGQPVPKDGDASLAEHKDAVPMTNLPQTSSTDTDTAADTTAKAPSSDKGSSAVAPTLPEIPTTEELTSDGIANAVEPTTKGKEKQSPSQPAASSQDDTLAIGPSVDDVQSITVSPSDGPVCNITLLLTTGARHPYKLDEKYLTKRNVNVPGLTEAGKKDPFSISVYTLKELILREWREEWDQKPASPSSIRLIHFGKLLDDKDQLKQYHFSAETANVVHMTVRPADIVEEEEPKGGNKSASGGSRSREGGGGCCVIL